jgi:hypothetical protein
MSRNPYAIYRDVTAVSAGDTDTSDRAMNPPRRRLNVQTTRPSAAFFQPVRNFPALVDMGVTVVAGPEVEGASSLAPDVLLQRERDWMTAADKAGLSVIVKRPWRYGTLPANVAGFMLSTDEPNAKGVPAANLKAESDLLRQFDSSKPIFLSLAGQNITSANWNKNADGSYVKPAEVQAFRDYLAVCDVVTVDVYPANSNASRYKPTWPADAVAKIRALSPGTPVWVWLECNDQRLNPPKPPDVNRAPTPDEITQSADAAVTAGASGVGFFFTCASGKYGWPESYLPQVDRNGVSMAPQYAAVKAIGLSRRATPVDPIAELRTQLAETTARAALAQQSADAAKDAAAATAADLASVRAAIAALNAAINPAPPTTQPSK